MDNQNVVVSDKCVMSGYLKKWQTTEKTFQKGWFLIENGTLSYYRSF
jgi:long-subunit acyl-CoA synthetase (AMP-forming)